MTNDKTMKIGVGLKGELRLVVKHSDGSEHDTGWFPNLILDAGLDRLGVATPNIYTYCVVGTGTNAPANSDTSLQSFTATNASALTSSALNTGSANYYVEIVKQYTFTLGAINANIAEIGVGWASGGGSLFSRARILDGGGSPTTLTVTSSDQLIAFYKLSTRPTLTDVGGTLTLSSVGYAFNSRVCDVDNFGAGVAYDLGAQRWGPVSIGGGYAETRGTGATMGSITGVPSGGTPITTAVAATTAAYVTGNFYNDMTITLSPSIHNPTGGIKTLFISFDMSLRWQWEFTTQIPKDNTKEMVFGVRLSWARL